MNSIKHADIQKIRHLASKNKDDLTLEELNFLFYLIYKENFITASVSHRECFFNILKSYKSSGGKIFKATADDLRVLSFRNTLFEHLGLVIFEGAYHTPWEFGWSWVDFNDKIVWKEINE